MTDNDDYERISVWLDKNNQEAKIKLAYDGREWEQLTRKEKTDTVSNLLYSGYYPTQAEKLSKGIDYVRGNDKEFTETKTITIDGKIHIVIRDLKGRIFKWL